MKLGKIKSSAKLEHSYDLQDYCTSYCQKLSTFVYAAWRWSTSKLS